MVLGFHKPKKQPLDTSPNEGWDEIALLRKDLSYFRQSESNLKRQLDDALFSLSKLKQLKHDREEEISQWKLRQTETQQSKRDCEHELEVLKRKHAEAQKVAQEYGREIERLKRGQTETLELLQRRKVQVDELQQEQKVFEQSYTQEINRINRNCDTEIANLKKQHEYEILAQRQQLTSKHVQNVNRLTEGHDAKMAQKEADLKETKQKAARQVHEQSLAHDQQLKEIRKAAASQLEEQEWSYKRQLSQKASQYQSSTQGLREDIESLNAALLTNDDDLYKGEVFTTSGLPALPDDKIYGQFSAIEQMVDSIGRLQWKQSPATWTNEVLDQVRGQHVDRVLKKAIVQDLVWSLLHDYVFCSPFRVFQEEGKALEMQWVRACGQGECDSQTKPARNRDFADCA